VRVLCTRITVLDTIEVPVRTHYGGHVNHDVPTILLLAALPVSRRSESKRVGRQTAQYRR
jgi:hypothetical protein